MDKSLIAMSFWIVLGNLWHGFLLAIHKSGKRPPTISEHAAGSQCLLWTHRVVHSIPLFIFSIVAFKILVPNGYWIAVILLISGALFDFLETITLNKKTASLQSRYNLHFATAWLMALCYFAYAFMISRIAGVNVAVYIPILLICVLLVVFSEHGVSRNKSLSMQMAYFMLVSLVVLLANVRLISR